MTQLLDPLTVRSKWFPENIEAWEENVPKRKAILRPHGGHSQVSKVLTKKDSLLKALEEHEIVRRDPVGLASLCWKCVHHTLIYILARVSVWIDKVDQAEMTWIS